MAVALVLPADAQVFLGRLTRLDPAAVVRLRPVEPGGRSGGAGVPSTEAGGDPRSQSPDEPGRTALWARLPWRVLVTREVALATPGDLTVGAAALLAGDRPARRDHDWRWPLPPSVGTVVEDVPARELREVAAAAAGTLREIAQTGLGGRAVGVRVVREALLDHVAIVVERSGEAGQAAGGPIDVPQRLVQAVVRMGFLGAVDEAAGSVVRVRLAGRWVGLAARFGTAWLPPPPGPLAMRPAALG